MNLADFVQIVIVVCSASGCILHTFPNFAAKRAAFTASLIGQPFWFYSAWTKGQWGVELLTGLFTIMAIRGLITHRRSVVDKAKVEPKY